MSRVPLVVNPAARTGRAGRDVDRAIDALRRLGMEPAECARAGPAATTAAIAELVDSGEDRVVVLGGDGMVHLAVQALAGTAAVLGVIPSGTGNDFAGSLGLPKDIEAAAARALGPATAIDLIRITAHRPPDDRSVTWAATVATLGFAADVNQRANTMARPRGSSRYTLATLLELPSLRARTVEIGVDGARHRVRATIVAIANTTRFGGGMLIAPLARCDDGLLDVTVVGAVGRLRLLRFFRRVFDGSHLELDDVERHVGARVELTCPGARLWADGEPVGEVRTERPVVLEAVVGALMVAADATPTAEG